MSFYTTYQKDGRLMLKRTRTNGLRFVLHEHTDKVVNLVSYRGFKHFKVPSFKKHVLNFAELKGEKKLILEKFFLKISFREHAFNRNKSRAFVAGTFPSLESDDVLKVYIILRANKDRRHFIPILEKLDPSCIDRRRTYRGYYFAVGVINRLVIFVCRSLWCECATHIDRFYLRDMKQRIQEISYFIHSRKIGNEMIDVVIPRYMTYVKRWVQPMIEDKPLPLYYLCLSKLLRVYCGCIQTQKQDYYYQKELYEDWIESQQE